MKNFVMKWFGVDRAATRAQKPLHMPAQATLPVMRTMTMPNGEKIHVMRDDAFNRAIERRKPNAA